MPLALWVDEPVIKAQQAATVTLFMVAMGVLAISARPLNLVRWSIILAMVGAFVLVLYVPFLSEFFALSLSPRALQPRCHRCWRGGCVGGVGVRECLPIVGVGLAHDRYRFVVVVGVS